MAGRTRDKTTFRDKAAGATDRPKVQTSATKKTGLNESDPVMSLAIRFEELAYENRVSLGGKGAPYLAAMFRDPVNRSGILGMKVRDGDGRLVDTGKVLRNVCRMFWEWAPWDRDGDVARQFADPIMFEECLDAVRKRWRNRYIHNQLVKQGKVSEGNRG